MPDQTKFPGCQVSRQPERTFVFHRDDVIFSKDENGNQTITMKKRGKFAGRYFHRPILILDHCQEPQPEQLKQILEYRIQEEPPTPQALKITFHAILKTEKNGSYDS